MKAERPKGAGAPGSDECPLPDLASFHLDRIRMINEATQMELRAGHRRALQGGIVYGYTIGAMWAFTWWLLFG